MSLHRRPTARFVAVACASALATVTVLALPRLRFAYEAPELRVALETSATLIALLTAYLVLGRFRRGRRGDDLALAVALGVLSLSNLIGAVVVGVGPASDGRLTGIGLGVGGALLLAVAAFSRPRPLEGPPRRVVLLGAALAAASVGVVFLLRDLFPANVTGLDVRDAARPHPAFGGVFLAQTAALVAFSAAALRFNRRAAAERDSFLAFVAVGAILAAFSRLHYVLFPPLDSGWVYTGDGFRVLFYSVLLAGAAREIRRYWRDLAAVAVLEERRRIARDLHDGVAQELAFIGRRAKRIAARSEDDGVRQIAAAADRALADSRRAIAALTRPLDQPLATVLAEALQDVAARHQVALDLDLDGGVDVPADAREALVRIGCEAVSNAAQHGQAQTIQVRLVRTDRVRLAVADDGCGFDVTQQRPGRFGLTIMRERAQGIGGALFVHSRPGAGTEVAVELP